MTEPSIAGLLGRSSSDSLSASALVIVDMTNAYVHPTFPKAALLRDSGVDLSAFWERTASLVIPNVGRLLSRYRQRHLRVLHIKAGANFSDFADASSCMRNYQRSLGVLRGTRDYEPLDELTTEELLAGVG